MPLAIWWSTWKKRNGRIFEGKARAIDDFKLYFLRTLYSSSQVLIHGTKLTFLDFVDLTTVECRELDGMMVFCNGLVL